MMTDTSPASLLTCLHFQIRPAMPRFGDSLKQRSNNDCLTVKRLNISARRLSLNRSVAAQAGKVDGNARSAEWFL